MKSRLIAAFALVAMMLLVISCTSSATADSDSGGQSASEEHMDGDDHTHSPAEHMAAAHNVPEEAAAVPNPVPFGDESVEIGGRLFADNCAVCHGDGGLGDGPTAESLPTKPANLTEAHVQALSDGALFYIISHGKPDTPMPPWENVLEEEERWQVINFLRTLLDDSAAGEHMDDGHMEDEHEHMEDEHGEDDHDHMETEHEHMEDEHTETGVQTE